jgi:hypothetical protein
LLEHAAAKIGVERAIRYLLRRHEQRMRGEFRLADEAGELLGLINAHPARFSNKYSS